MYPTSIILYFLLNTLPTVGPSCNNFPMSAGQEVSKMENIGIIHAGRVLMVAGTCECGNYVTGDSLVVAIRGQAYCKDCA